MDLWLDLEKMEMNIYIYIYIHMSCMIFGRVSASCQALKD